MPTHRPAAIRRTFTGAVAASLAPAVALPATASPTDVTVEVTGGSLSTSAPADARSLGTTVNTVAGTTISSPLGEVQVNDPRSAAAGSGWSLEGPPAADFTIDSLTASRSADGGPLVLATVHNTCGRALDLPGELELLDGLGGLCAGPFPARLGSTLAIGGSGRVVIPLDAQIPDGPWRSTITPHSGLLERSTQAALTFPRAGSATPGQATPVHERWHLLIVAGLRTVVLGAALLWAFARQHRYATPDHQLATEGPGEPVRDEATLRQADVTSVG